MNKPLLLDYICKRSGDDISPAFTYDRCLDMNVIKTSRGEILFIESNCDGRELHTETRIQREREDSDGYVSELLTKTDAQREQDDEVACCWPEFVSKTEVSREREDDPLSELFSKTFADRERDDEDDSANY